jgi:hypothetical protein
LSLNMAHGTFYMAVGVRRHDIEKTYDFKAPASTVFVGSKAGVRGAVNCFPKIVRHEVYTKSDRGCPCHSDKYGL